jgi:hypothetical protein
VAKQPSNLDRAHPERERERRTRVTQIVAADRLAAAAVQAGVPGGRLQSPQDVAPVKRLAARALEDERAGTDAIEAARDLPLTMRLTSAFRSEGSFKVSADSGSPQLGLSAASRRVFR